MGFLKGSWQPIVLFILGVMVALLTTTSSQGFSPDSYYYVDTARHIADGDGVSTDILVASSEPELPTSLSLWPPLYPVLIAGVSKLGVDIPTAARVISIVSFGLSLSLVWLLGSMLFSRKVGLVSAFLLAVWPATTDVAAMAWSENLFILLILLSAVLTVKGMDPNLARRWQYVALAGGGLAMGSAALTRYSGLPLIPIGGALILLWDRRSPSWIERLGKGVLWFLLAAIPAILWLMRNVRTAGSAMQPNRPPDADGPLFHLYFALKTIATDSLDLISRITLLPELLHLRLWVPGIVVLLVIGVVLALALRRGGLAKGLREAGRTPLRSPESRFVLGMGLGYWGAMWVARSASIFDNLNSRMMMPAYPLLAIIAVASFGALVHSLWPEARTFLVAAVTVLCVASIAAVVLPHGITKGGPQLKPDAAPDYVDWVAANTETGSLIAGNSAWDYNFYLKRPVVAFYDTPDQMSPFNSQKISNILTRIEPEHAYFVLCPEEDGETLDATLMGDRYGPMVADLLADDQSNPALRPIVHAPDLAAWEILDYSWECN